MDRDEVRRQLAVTLQAIGEADKNKQYSIRYSLIIQAMALATMLDWAVGFDVDLRVDPPGFPIVAYIELPAYGQLSWHMPPHGKPFDGHTTEQKYHRIMNFVIDTFRE